VELGQQLLLTRVPGKHEEHQHCSEPDGDVRPILTVDECRLGAGDDRLLDLGRLTDGQVASARDDLVSADSALS